MAARIHKGRSIIDLPTTYTIVDLETTGLDPEWCDIIEVAALRIEDGTIVEEFSELINPGYAIPSFITDLTGIDDEMLANARSTNEVLRDYYRFLGDSLLMAHNAHFDINFLYDKKNQVDEEPFTNEFVCTLRMARKAYPSERNNRVKDLAHRIGLDTSKAHRALEDCMLLKEIYDALRSRILEKHSLEEYKALFNRKSPSALNAGEIIAESNEFDNSHPLFERYVAFTGSLDSMLRRDAMQLVANTGGVPQNGVTKQTNYLVIGSTEYRKSIKQGRTNKMRKADAMKADGNDIEIISESVFLDMVEDQLEKRRLESAQQEEENLASAQEDGERAAAEQLDNFERQCLEALSILFPEKELRWYKDNSTLHVCNCLSSVVKISRLKTRGYYLRVKSNFETQPFTGELEWDQTSSHRRFFLEKPEDLLKLERLISQLFEVEADGFAHYCEAYPHLVGKYKKMYEEGSYLVPRSNQKTS